MPGQIPDGCDIQCPEGHGKPGQNGHRPAGGGKRNHQNCPVCPGDQGSAGVLGTDFRQHGQHPAAEQQNASPQQGAADPHLPFIAEGAQKTAVNFPLAVADAVGDSIIKCRAGGPDGDQGQTAEAPQQAQQQHIRDVVEHRPHQSVGPEYRSEHITPERE